MADLAAAAWPASRLGEAIEGLARRSGMTLEPRVAPAPPLDLPWDNVARAGKWIEATSQWLGLEAEPVTLSYAELDEAIRRAAPALLYVPGDEPRFLALLRFGRRKVGVLGPDMRVHWLDVETIRSTTCQRLEAPFAERLDMVLASAGIPARSYTKARASLLRMQLGSVPIRACWLLRLPPSSSFLQQLRHARIPARLASLLALNLIQMTLFVLSWWIIGRAVLQGQLEWGWLIAWALLLVSMVPFRALATWTQGTLAIYTSSLLKQRLLVGALRIDQDEIRHQGAGQLLGRVIEAEAIESLALSGGFLALSAVVEIAMAAWVLSEGAGGGLHVVLLAIWLAITCAMCWALYRRLRQWTQKRLSMTHDLVERMTGHRTRLAQERPDRWHFEEDQALERYVELSRRMDNLTAVAGAVVPRGWLLVGLAGLAPAFVAGESTMAATAIGLGGVLLASQALRKVSASLSNLGAAAVAWTQVRALFHAAGKKHIIATPDVAGRFHDAADRDRQRGVIDATGITFRYQDRTSPVLRGCDLHLAPGDRLLLEGPSGSGKSTLAAVLTGLREPDSGLILLDGLDRQTLGAESWRQRIAAAPQFHENHILAGSLAFNLLMGRRWPAEPIDLEQAEQVCRELELGTLLDRMPSGLQQMVGDTGWQLSHGEKSRVFIARALLQDADVIVLDESFASLDPATLQRCLQCVLNRARSVVVIAHP